MAPLLVLGAKLLLPVLFNEAVKKLNQENVEAVPVEDVQKEAARVAVAAVAKSVTTSKTVWFSIGLGILGVIEQHADVLGPMLGQRWGWLLVAIGGATAVLRTVTKASLVEKAEPKE